MKDAQLKALIDYIKPSVSNLLIFALFLFCAILGFVACIFSFFEGDRIATEMLIVTILFSVIAFVGLRKYKNDSDQGFAYVSVFAKKYGHDALLSDFCAARPCTRGDDFRLGQRFLYSKHASIILPYSEITSVYVTRETNYEHPDDYLIKCVHNAFSTIIVSCSPYAENASCVPVIQAHIDAVNCSSSNAANTMPKHSISAAPPRTGAANQSARQYSQEELEIIRALYQDGSITEEEYRQCFER